MRLCYVHNIAMPGAEANTVNVAKMCDAFAANGCDVTLLALPNGPASNLGARIRDHYALHHPITITALPPPAARPAIAALAGVAMARRAGAELIYTRTPHVALAACLAGLPTALELHTDIDAFSGLGRSALMRAIPRLTAAIAISDALAQRLRQRLPHLTAPLIVAHDGADEIAPQTAPPSARFSAGFVGRFYRGKGLELIAQLAPLCPWADFHLVGGDHADAARILSDAIAPNMIFHGSVPHAQVPAFIGQWDIVLAPYQRAVIVADGATNAAQWMSPLKIFEYMAAGKTMLASDLPVLREILTDGETALLLAPDDAQAWAEALTSLRDQPDRRQRLAASARASFLARYSWRQRAAHILQALRPPAPRVA